MRALIVADVHSNLEALEAVMTDASQREGFDTVWSLGDVVGYGPDPGPCIDLLRSHDLVCVAGNHDFAAIGKIGTDEFNPFAAAAARWTASQLKSDHVSYLANLAKVERCENFILVHGSLRDPIWEYLVGQLAALDSFSRLESSYCLVGHSHMPFLCVEMESDVDFRSFVEGKSTALGPNRMIINPGSVGQPRDGDPRSSYAIYDNYTGTIVRYRVTYDISVTQEKMRRAGMPNYLVQRLSKGQ